MLRNNMRFLYKNFNNFVKKNLNSDLKLTLKILIPTFQI